MTDELQRVETERQEPTFYARIPKMATLDLDPYELALYCNYKQTASDHGLCTKSNATLAEETKMSVSKVKLARKALADKGFINITRHKDADGVENQTITVTIVDIWGENHARFAKNGGHEKTTPGYVVTGRGSPHNPPGVTKKPQRRTIQEQPPLDAAGSGDRPTIYMLYEQNIGMLTPMIGDALKDLAAEFPADWIAEAFKIAVEANARKLSYVRGVLTRWQRDGRGAPNKPAVTGIPQTVYLTDGGEDADA